MGPDTEMINKPLERMVEQGMTITRIENETQIAVAIQKPRNQAKIVQELQEGLETNPEYASKAYYSIPYKNSEGGTTMVEGPSIKAAMELARCWGNSADGARVIEDQEDRIIVEGVFMDYERNRRTTRQVSVAKQVWSKFTKTVTPLREDRLNMAIQAGMSKAVRNAILANLPVHLVDMYWHFAKKVAAGTLKPKPATKTEKAVSRLDKAFEKFSLLKVTREQFDEYCKGSSKETEEELVSELIGIYNSIKDGIAKVEDIFGGTDAKPVIQGTVKSDQLFK